MVSASFFNLTGFERLHPLTNPNNASPDNFQNIPSGERNIIPARRVGEVVLGREIGTRAGEAEISDVKRPLVVDKIGVPPLKAATLAGAPLVENKIPRFESGFHGRIDRKAECRELFRVRILDHRGGWRGSCACRRHVLHSQVLYRQTQEGEKLVREGRKQNADALHDVVKVGLRGSGQLGEAALGDGSALDSFAQGVAKPDEETFECHRMVAPYFL
jgi:hypothetical protein